MPLRTTQAAQLLRSLEQAETLAAALWNLYNRSFASGDIAGGQRAKRLYDAASARNERRLTAWRAFLAAGHNDDWSVAQ